MRHPEPIVFYCSCGDGIGPFTMLRRSDVVCSECGTQYDYTDGVLYALGRFFFDRRVGRYVREPHHSHAINLEYPA